MAALETAMDKRGLDQLSTPDISHPKRFKSSDLPLSAAQKSAIDGLVHTIKKKGIYDKLRHDLLAQFMKSVGCAYHHMLLHRFRIAADFPTV